MKLGQSLSLGKRKTLQGLKGVQGMENILQRCGAVQPELVQNLKLVRQVTSSCRTTDLVLKDDPACSTPF
jgi:hypothetical protein